MRICFAPIRDLPIVRSLAPCERSCENSYLMLPLARLTTWLCTTAFLVTFPAGLSGAVVQSLTYLGGSGLDRVQAIACDSAGNTVVAGFTTSTNFPGAGGLSAGLSMFVSKISRDGSSLIFTTTLGTINGFFPATSTYSPSAHVTAMDIDTDGSIFIVGTNLTPNFPLSANAWSRTPGGFAAKLNAAGRIVYATYLNFKLLPTRIAVRNGIAYIGGATADPAFLGTPGAWQRTIAGSADFFILALAADGSEPL